MPDAPTNDSNKSQPLSEDAGQSDNHALIREYGPLRTSPLLSEDEDLDQLLTFDEAADRLGYAPRTIRQLVQTGKLPTHPIGNGRARGIALRSLVGFKPGTPGHVSHITPEQWASIDRAIALGEPRRSVAAREGIHRSTIFRHEQAMKNMADGQDLTADE